MRCPLMIHSQSLIHLLSSSRFWETVEQHTKLVDELAVTAVTSLQPLEFLEDPDRSLPVQTRRLARG
jgi:hypothetical protein